MVSVYFVNITSSTAYKLWQKMAAAYGGYAAEAFVPPSVEEGTIKSVTAAVMAACNANEAAIYRHKGEGSDGPGPAFVEFDATGCLRYGAGRSTVMVTVKGDLSVSAPDGCEDAIAGRIGALGHEIVAVRSHTLKVPGHWERASKVARMIADNGDDQTDND